MTARQTLRKIRAALTVFFNLDENERNTVVAIDNLVDAWEHKEPNETEEQN